MQTSIQSHSCNLMSMLSHLKHIQKSNLSYKKDGSSVEALEVDWQKLFTISLMKLTVMELSSVM